MIKIINILKEIIKNLLFLFAYFISLIISIFHKKKIKFFIYNKGEIGAGWNLDNYLRQFEPLKNHDLVCVTIGTHIANSYFEKLKNNLFEEKNITTIKNKYINFILNYLFRFHNKFVFQSKVQGIIEFKNYRNTKKLNWIKCDKSILKAELKNNLGMDKDSWFVCFFSRDSLYDIQNRSSLAEIASIRNSDINTYSKSMKFIADQGGYAIRIGSTQRRKINFEYDRVIDYSFSDIKNPKNDFLLSFFANFIIGSSSGIVDISSLNDVPVGLVNCPFYRFQQARKRVSFIPKIIMNSKNEVLKRSTYLEKMGEYDDQKDINSIFTRYNWRHLDNDENDILEITKYFYKNIISNSNNTQDEIKFEFDHEGLKIFKPFVDKYPELMN